MPKYVYTNMNYVYITNIYSCHASDIVYIIYTDDISVDWINDKLYWIDSDPSLIGEYDLRTGLYRIVMFTGTAESDGPFDIVVYPYPNYGCVWFIYT